MCPQPDTSERRNVEACPADLVCMECENAEKNIECTRLKSNQACTAVTQHTEQASFTDCNVRFTKSVWATDLE